MSKATQKPNQASKPEIPTEVLSGTGNLPKAPFFAVGCVFALALFCLAITLTLLPHWQHKQAEQALAAKTYKFTQAAVILPNAKSRAEHRARHQQQDNNFIKTPAQNAPENTPESTPKKAVEKYEGIYEEINPDLPVVNSGSKTLKTGQNISRTVPFLTKNEQNLPKWRKNAHPVSIPEGHAAIAIVIDDMGVADANSQAVIDRLPAAVTLAFLAYGEATNSQAKQAFNKGHDIMIHLPMQPHRHTANPGPNALYVSDETAQLKRKIKLNFKDLKHISVGVNNHMGSKLTEDLPAMRTVLEAVEAEDMFFLDSVTTNNSSVLAASTGLNLPVLQRHVFLDHEVTPTFINNALAKAYPATTAAIEAWAKTLADKQISLIPISNLLQ